jgi:hypothetical protein
MVLVILLRLPMPSAVIFNLICTNNKNNFTLQGLVYKSSKFKVNLAIFAEKAILATFSH